MFQKPDPKPSFPALEHEILAYWKKTKMFEKSLEKNKGKREYSFYDGPPFATGMPHYGHILAGTLKDVVPRYQTMRGYYVPRRWGWDCHGLPIENLIEQELQLKSKKEIAEFGVDKFNEACRASVLRYASEWGKVVERMGRWVDFEDSYKTMDSSYMESIWWVFKKLWDKKLIYRDKKAMHICPRCETPLSNFEVGQGYKDVSDLSVIWKFRLASEPQTFLLAWTTTPWSTLSTMGLSINPKFTYVKVKMRDFSAPPSSGTRTASVEMTEGEYFIFAKERLDFVMKGVSPDQYEVVEEFSGKKLIGMAYEHIAPWYGELPEIKQNKRIYQVYAGDYVEVTEGTGIVTINGSYGEIDMAAAKKNKLPMLMDVAMNGKFTHHAGLFAGMNVKDAEPKLVEYFGAKGLVFRSEPYAHSYPHCWRCDTPLLNYCADSWFVAVEKIKKKMLAANNKIHWVPEHLKHGRFGKWLENARDWAISRNRYWGTPLPVWAADAREAVRSGVRASSASPNGAQDSEPEISKKFPGKESFSLLQGEKGTMECLGSLADLRARIPGRFTKITLVRHGESEGNVVGLRQSKPPGTSLTKKGMEQVKATAKVLKKIHAAEPFDLMVSSPLLRARETAEIVRGQLFGGTGGSGLRSPRAPQRGALSLAPLARPAALTLAGHHARSGRSRRSGHLPPALQVYEDPLITEIDFGQTEGKRETELKEYIAHRHTLTPELHYKEKSGEIGESHHDVAQRALEFVKKMMREHAGKSILVVTHSDTLRFLMKELYGQSLEMVYGKGHFPQAGFQEIYLDNETGTVVDLHKHLVDGMTYKHPTTGELMKRIPEVLDCWFESGAMPYAQVHYPFENKERFEKTFPANFIAEGLDQTRGWFYTLVVLAAALFDEPAFQNIIVNGIVLAEDGQKMSKRKKNYPDPSHIFETYGVDAMRMYLMNSPVVKADDLRFSEKGVQEVVRSALLPLWNAYSFFLTYADTDHWRPNDQIYFVRHGETQANRDLSAQGSLDEPLHYKGIEHVEELRQLIDTLPIDVIVCSDLLRAKQTAEILNSERGLVIDVMAGLREQDFGEYEGMSFEEIRKKFGGTLSSRAKLRRKSEGDGVERSRNVYYAFRENPPKGETLEAFGKRVLTALEQVKKKYAGKNILIVSHAGVYHVMKKQEVEERDWEKYFNNPEHYSIKNAEMANVQMTNDQKWGNPLDKWVLSELHTLIKGMTEGLDAYDLMKGLAPLVRFIDSLTNWYIRRSRRRFWKSENDADKEAAYQTLYMVLVTTCKLLAPFAPFVSEAMYRNLTGLPSVHLAEWPEYEHKYINQSLNQEMDLVRLIVMLGHAARAKAKVKVRQPLGGVEVILPPVISTDSSGSQGEGGVEKSRISLIRKNRMRDPSARPPKADSVGMTDAIIKEELNVKAVEFLQSAHGKVQMIVKPNARLLGPKFGAKVQDIIREAKAGHFKQLANGNVEVLGHALSKEEIEIGYQTVEAEKGSKAVEAQGGVVIILDTTVTPELKREGYARDIVRTIQDLRKRADLHVADRIRVGLTTSAPGIQQAIDEFEDYIKRETLAVSISAEKLVTSFEEVLDFDGHGVVVTMGRL